MNEWQEWHIRKEVLISQNSNMQGKITQSIRLQKFFKFKYLALRLTSRTLAEIKISLL